MTIPDIEEFFCSEEISVYAVVDIKDIPVPDRDYVLEFFPKAESVIVFAKEIPSPVYVLPPKEKTREMLVIAESLDKSARLLSGLLNAEKIPSIPVPLYLPVTITEGKVRGVVRLKKIAAAGGLGETGKSSILITPEYGPRVFLSGVVTAFQISKSGDNTINDYSATPLCTGCGLCVKNCPAEVFGPEGVDTFKCRTIRPWVPPVTVPFMKWFLKRRMLLRLAAPIAPCIARFATMPCSNCVTGCPRF